MNALRRKWNINPQATRTTKDEGLQMERGGKCHHLCEVKPESKREHQKWKGKSLTKWKKTPKNSGTH